MVVRVINLPRILEEMQNVTTLELPESRMVIMQAFTELFCKFTALL